MNDEKAMIACSVQQVGMVKRAYMYHMYDMFPEYRYRHRERQPTLLGFFDSRSKRTKSHSGITRQARHSRALFIWTDCDREGEFIGSELRQAVLKGNGGGEGDRYMDRGT